MKSVSLFATLLLVSACQKKQSFDASVEKAYRHTDSIVSFGPRPPESENLAKVRRYIIQTLEQHGWTIREQTFTTRTPYGSKTFTNLIARFGSRPNWQSVPEGILCAHFESKNIPGKEFLGADDAASAVGLILAMAESLSHQKARATRLELVFFDGEESFGENLTAIDGLYGSKHYARKWIYAPKRPSFAILLDLIGHKNLTIRYPSDTPQKLNRLLTKIAADTGNRHRVEQSPYPIVDDHVPLQNAGIPTINLIGNFTQSTWWHTENDDMSIISKESLALTHLLTKTLLEKLLPL